VKKELLFLLGFVLILGFAIGTSLIGKTLEKASEEETAAVSKEQVVVPQLTSDEREEAATMVLLGAPPMQPADHIDRWNPELRHESCLACHATPEATGAKEIPENHFYENNRENPIFRDNCVQCHGQQNDTKSAFNSEE